MQYTAQWAKTCLLLLRLVRAVSPSQMDKLDSELDTILIRIQCLAFMRSAVKV